MPKPYSQDLRERIVKTYDACQDYEQTSKQYNVHPSTVRRWINRRDNEGHYHPKPNGHRPRRTDVETLKTLALDEVDHTQKEMARQLGVSQSTVAYHLRQEKITYKKNGSLRKPRQS